MAESKTINTRIVLRNDTLANWEESNTVLLKGEVALAFDGSDVKMLIGDGTKKWSELSGDASTIGNIKFGTGNISALESYVSDKETNTTYKLLSAELTSGETGKSYKLQKCEKGSTEWSDVDGSRFNVPTFDPGTIENRLSTVEDQLSSDKEGSVNARIATALTDAKAYADDLCTSLSNEVNAKLGNYALSTDVDNISSGLFDKIVTDSAAAKAAGELSAQAVRNDLTTFVKYSNVTKTVTETNKVVTQDDIVALTGTMHFKGVATNDELSTGSTTVPVPPYSAVTDTPVQGDFVIDKVGSEFVWAISASGGTGCWYKVGDETLYAKKADLDTHINNTDVHVTTTEKDTWNTKATSADVSAIASAYCDIEETRATSIEEGLRTDVDAISVQVKDFSNEWKAAVDLSVSNLSTYASSLSTDLGAEAIKRRNDDFYLSNILSGVVKDLSDYALSSDVDSISGSLFDQISSVSSSIEGEIAAEVTARTDADTYISAQVSAAIANYLSAIKLNGVDFTVSNHAAELLIDIISCGNANS